jgi:hypothetical protein
VASLGALVPQLRPWAAALLDVATRANIRPVVTSTYRSHTKQAALYQQFLAGKSPYPVAPPGTSAHEYRMAFDVAVDNLSDLNDLGSVWESWGGVWGGRFGDPVHFEFPGFSPAKATPTSTHKCGGWAGAISTAADFVLGFAPGIGEVELVATLVSYGFPRSRVLKWLSSPISGTVCGVS